MSGMERELLHSRVDDALQKSERGILATLPFLTPRDCRRASLYLLQRGASGQAFFWGGYREAERKVLFLLPDYLVACIPSPVKESSDEELLELLGEDLTDAVFAVKITGSGYRTLSHRDYLGAVLHLGLERDAIGDIAVQNEKEAVLFCPRKLTRFFEENLVRVANDAVHITPYTPDESFTDGRRYRAISDTVASPRLDCVLASLCNLSRDAAQTLIRSGAVEVEFEQTDRTDLSLVPSVSISARGYGRFILRAFDGETKKGRLRLRADQLV